MKGGFQKNKQANVRLFILQPRLSPLETRQIDSQPQSVAWPYCGPGPALHTTYYWAYKSTTASAQICIIRQQKNKMLTTLGE